MEIIPVLDLKAGHVVHARRGHRDSYQPIVSRLCPSSMPRDVLAALVQLHAFGNVYIADLDAIEKTGEHAQMISELTRQYPGIEFWLDAGGTARAGMPGAGNIRGVIGSESLRDLADLGASEPAAILSLDFRGEDFLGPPGLVATPALWPDRIIVMTLARVGSGAGPDLERLASIKRRAGARRVYAAGGVRGRHDLEALRDAGIAGVLVASALHDGRLTSADLARFG
jgi:phosphoribosylformimino-5-aminoimidazole carboxamide ribotide isomerase